MAAGKGQRVGTAVGFLGGLLLCLGAVRDARMLWPPAALWSVLEHPQHLMLGSGIALIIVSLLISLRRTAPEP
jgi:hypothetical protein